MHVPYAVQTPPCCMQCHARYPWDTNTKAPTYVNATAPGVKGIIAVVVLLYDAVPDRAAGHVEDSWHPFADHD
jgi:hypothetical protein